MKAHAIPRTSITADTSEDLSCHYCGQHDVQIKGIAALQGRRISLDCWCPYCGKAWQQIGRITLTHKDIPAITPPLWVGFTCCLVFAGLSALSEGYGLAIGAIVGGSLMLYAGSLRHA